MAQYSSSSSAQPDLDFLGNLANSIRAAIPPCTLVAAGFWPLLILAYPFADTDFYVSAMLGWTFSIGAIFTFLSAQLGARGRKITSTKLLTEFSKLMLILLMLTSLVYDPATSMTQVLSAPFIVNLAMVSAGFAADFTAFMLPIAVMIWIIRTMIWLQRQGR